MYITKIRGRSSCYPGVQYKSDVPIAVVEKQIFQLTSYFLASLRRALWQATGTVYCP